MTARRLLATLFLAACARPISVVSTPGSAVSASVPNLGQPQSSAEARRTEAWADSVLGTMSLRDKVAQLVWPFILGTYTPTNSEEWARITRLVTDQHVGGFIVSVGAPMDIATKVNALQEMSGLPLLISADLETGVGFRARGSYFLPNAIDIGGATNFPLQMALGAAGDTSLAYELGRVTAVEGRALGMHIAYGPVLDVNNNPANPVIGARSISEDPQVTARMGAEVVRGLQENGMLATGKHFPGHGDTETNSHLALSSVTASRARLDSVELLPFRAAIDARVGAMMTFHGYLPALDSAQIPATLSPKVMSALLREELKFDGLLITDAMDMGGVVNKFGGLEASKRAIAAGADILLMPSDVPGSIDAVVAGVAEGRYPEARIDASVRRVLALKHRFGLHRQRTVPLERVRQVVGDPAHAASALRLAERSFVLVRDSGGVVPIANATRKPATFSITYARRNELGAGTQFNSELRRGVGALRQAYVNADDPAPNNDRVVADAGQADVIVVGSYVNISSETATADAPKAFADLIARLMQTGKPVVLISFGTPYLLNQVPSVRSYAVAWGGSPASQVAAARAILGEIPITAKLPTSIPPYVRIGAGEERRPGQ